MLAIIKDSKKARVLILVVVEDVLVLVVEDVLVHGVRGQSLTTLTDVLVLVVEDVLVPYKKTRSRGREGCSSTCGGRCSSTELYKTKLIINKLKNFTKQIFTFLNRKLTIS